MTLVLASASPARLATLRDAGIAARVLVSRVDETAVLAAAGTDLPPAQQVLALARAKGHDVAEQLVAQHGTADLVLGCDSMLELDGEVVGKPGDAVTARARWRAMRGRSGVLHTGHWLAAAAGTTDPREVQASSATVVHFAALSDAEIDAYVATGEPLAVAGGFTIDGIGGAFIDRIEGDHLNVIGVSVSTVRTMVGELGAGFSWSDLWAERPSV